MKSDFKKALKKELAAQMAARLPQFKPVNSREGLTYRSMRGEHLWLFIRFQPSKMPREAFTIELARSPIDRWPEETHLSIPIDLPERGLIRTTPSHGEYRFRFGILLPSHQDYWWELTPSESIEIIIKRFEDLNFRPIYADPLGTDAGKLRSLVDDAVDKLREYGVTYLHAN